MVRFPDVQFPVRLPLCIAVQFVEVRSTHLSVDRKENYCVDETLIPISHSYSDDSQNGTVGCRLYIHPHPIPTCVPGIVAGGPGQRVPETIDKVEEGPGQDNAVDSGINLDRDDRISDPCRDRINSIFSLSQF